MKTILEEMKRKAIAIKEPMMEVSPDGKYSNSVYPIHSHEWDGKYCCSGGALGFADNAILYVIIDGTERDLETLRECEFVEEKFKVPFSNGYKPKKII